jgi:hypothetical protein
MNKHLVKLRLAIGHLCLVATAALLFSAPASGQEVNSDLYVVDNCETIYYPVTNGAWCFQRKDGGGRFAGKQYLWKGSVSGWVDQTVSSSSGDLSAGDNETVTGAWTFTQSITGNLTGNVTGNLTGNVTGNATTATGLAANGTNCDSGEAPRGVDEFGNAESCTSIGGGGGGTANVLDLGNDAVIESTDLIEIATSGDTFSIFSEPTANKLLIDLAQKWPVANLATTATALTNNGANCLNVGEAPRGVDAAGAAEDCFDVATQTELNTHAALTGTSAHSAASTNTASAIVTRDGSGNFAAGTITASLTGNVTGTASLATALANNPTNCGPGLFPQGIDASGVVETCTDLALQTELNTHAALTGTSAHGAVATNTASQIVTRDGSGNFAAGTITANLTGNVTGTVTGNASTATTAGALTNNGGNCSTGSFPLGVNTLGAVEDCTALPTTISGTSGQITASAATGPVVLTLPDVVVDGSSHFAADAGGSDAYASCPISLSGMTTPAYVQGAIHMFRANTANSAGATWDGCAIGAKALVKSAGGLSTALDTGDVRAGQILIVSYQSTADNFQVLSTLGNVASVSVPGSDTQVIFNDGGSLGADAGMTYNKATDVLTALGGLVGGDISSNSLAFNTSAVTGSKTATFENMSGTVNMSANARKVVQIEVFPAGTAASTGDGKAYFRIPTSMNGMVLVAVTGNVYTAGATGTLNFDIAKCSAAATGNVCSGTVADVLSTNGTIDTAENSTSTAAAALVINTSNDDVITGDVLRFDVDAVHTTPSEGFLVNLEFSL